MVISNSILSLLLILIAVTLFFGFLVLVTNHGWNKLVNRRFFLFTILVVLWQIVNLLMLASKDLDTALFWTRSSFASAILMIYFLLRFVFIFPKTFSKNKNFNLFINIIALLTTLFTFLMSFTSQLVKSVYFEDHILLAQYGSFFPVFSITIIVYLIVVLLIAYLNYRKSSAESKIQIKFMLVGIAGTAVFAIFTDLISPFILGNDLLSNFGVFGTVFLVGFMAYAIVKYELFDIRVILTETAVAIVILAVSAQLVFVETVTERIINFVILAIVSYGGYLLIKSVQEEIKRRKQLQTLSTQLQHANEHLKELDRMKTEFVSLASHELLTPVSAIEGYLSMLLDEKLARVDDPKAVHYMDRVYRSAKRLARLVTDMLNVSRIEEGRLLVEKKEVSLSGLIEQTIDELKFKAEEKKQKVTLSSANHWLTFGDSDKIKEILVNLLGNSIKYSKEPGTITVSVETKPTAVVQDKWSQIESEIKNGPLDDQEAIKSATDERLRRLIGEKQILIHIKDEGIGIPKEELPKLFKKFHRVGDYTTAESQGTGLGLYISRALVELHHGRIWADSEGHSHGSTFTFSLPEASSQKEIQDLEAQVQQKKEQLKPLAQPPKEAEEL